MPNIKSAAKRHRQSLVRRSRNRSVKSELKTHVKSVLAAANSGDIAKAESAFRIAAKRLDQAGSRQVIHKNAAARRKSRLAHAILRAKNGNASTTE